MGAAILIFLIFTGATAIACEVAIWGPERKTQEAAEMRLRGLRAAQTQQRAGPLLRQQSLSSIGFLDVIFTKMRFIRQLQKAIDQTSLGYRAGSVLSLSLLLFAGGIGITPKRW